MSCNHLSIHVVNYGNGVLCSATCRECYASMVRTDEPDKSVVDAIIGVDRDSRLAIEDGERRAILDAHFRVHGWAVKAV